MPETQNRLPSRVPARAIQALEAFLAAERSGQFLLDVQDGKVKQMRITAFERLDKSPENAPK